MKVSAFALRNFKEMVRDKLNLFFGLGFPIMILLLLTLINSGIPEEAQMNMFDIEKLAPGIAVFGLSFISLFSGFLISKDRCSSFMMRLFTSPMTAGQFIMGYTLPLVPIALVQTMVTFVCALCLGLEFTVNILLCIAVNIPAAVLFIGIGLLCGTLLNDKQVGGICGALLTNLSAWLSGIWFSVDGIVGLSTAAKILPFLHAVNAGRAALSGNYSDILPELLWVSAYAIGILVIAAILFTRKMNSDAN